jgi:hypothetical protein
MDWHRVVVIASGATDAFVDQELSPEFPGNADYAENARLN